MNPAIPKLRRRIAEIEARKPLTRAEALFVLAQQAPGPVLCGCGCGVPVDPLGEGVVDEHVVALELTGTNALGNRQFWRKPCAAAKTKRDAAAIAKAKRLAGETCTVPGKPIPQRADPWPPKGSRPLRSRGFGPARGEVGS